MGTVYKISKQLCGSFSRQSSLVKDKNRNALPTERQQAAREVWYFQEVLNRPEPEDPADPQPTEADLLINTDTPGEEEIRSAIKSLKSGKARGIDNIHAEMVKGDVYTATRVLTDLFRNVWEEETILDDWNKSLIVKLPKKGVQKTVPIGEE